MLIQVEGLVKDSMFFFGLKVHMVLNNFSNNIETNRVPLQFPSDCADLGFPVDYQP